MRAEEDLVVEEARRWRLVVLDVGGEKFSTQRTLLAKFPTTRLGRLMRARTVDCVVQLCDEVTFRPDRPPEFYFDKAGGWSLSLLTSYSTGQTLLTSVVKSDQP